MSLAAAGSFVDHPRKILFRRIWAKPILKYLNNRLGKKLIYVGLPGIKALDILEWKEHLKVIVAFQVYNYENRLSSEEAEEELQELIGILNDLETKSFIETYALYVGYMEQVIMGEEDDNNLPFVLNNYITVYNLDFCNALSTPIPVTDKDARTFECYKTDVIEKLLSIQRTKFVSGSDACFTMFLTVSASFIEIMVSKIDDDTVKAYIANNLKGVVKEKRSARLLKVYAFYKLKQIFRKHGFNMEMLPTIYYQGSGTYFHKERQKDVPFWLSTFTILGTPIEINNPPVDYDQDFKEFLEKKFVFISDTSVSCYTDMNGSIQENDYTPTIEHILSNSHTITTLWAEPENLVDA